MEDAAQGFCLDEKTVIARPCDMFQNNRNILKENDFDIIYLVRYMNEKTNDANKPHAAGTWTRSNRVYIV